MGNTSRTTGETVFLLGLFFVGLGCSNLYSEGQAEKAVAAIREKTGRNDFRTYVVKVTPEQLTLRVEDPEKPGKLQQWWYYKGEAWGPKRVDVYGEGSIEPGLFPLSGVDFGAVARMAKDASDLWKIDAHTMELRFREDAARQQLVLKWQIEGKKDAVFASKEGVVPVPTATRVADHAGKGEWEQAIDLCNYSYMKHNKNLLAACEAIFDPAFEHLAQAGKQAKIRTQCLQPKLALSDALAKACARHQAAAAR